ncbi:baseplate J/gp47 family protein [Plasticicumulans acidivorans]|uniref:Putative phage baseplate assembly protein n=1 Tax=Plasticicumulans acidivorans TaxID=886464 RepID=A0A317MU83_9GAMM|nr:baseplate J/gp47 family protein [Plasticicumulans acidivorans]PWV61195.1 putative phage baseplate assembly protein [Plasticicumulans acidivorans]
MSAIQDSDAIDERARDLAALDLNGLAAVLVALTPPAPPGSAWLELHFVNDRHVAAILAAVALPGAATALFPIRGGHRLPAGPAAGQVRCTAVAAGPDAASLRLSVEPVGDYSTYTLELVWDAAELDPFFAALAFRFRPGCFTNDCAAAAAGNRAAAAVPAIDYLAKDYDSFRHLLMSAMAARVPAWQPTSEADLDQVLIDLFAAAADELSDYQDRTLAEATLASARKRVSLVRHARLMDYQVHQGNQASTWLALLLDPLAIPPALLPLQLDSELQVWAGHADDVDAQVWFASRETRLPPAARRELDPLLNVLRVHTWADAQPALAAGSTSADLLPVLAGGATQAHSLDLAARINSGRLPQLLIEEKLNPHTGRAAGRDPRKRQLLTLLPDARVLRDPVADAWPLRVHWADTDALRYDYAVLSYCGAGGARIDDISLLHGNLLPVHQGRLARTHFHEAGSDLPLDQPGERHRHYRRRYLYGEPRGVLCALPDAPLAWLPTPPGGEVAPRSTLQLSVEAGGLSEPWDEVTELVHSDDSAEEGDHYVVETDELGRSTLRFGDGINGRWLADGAIVHTDYQVLAAGGGLAGNVGAQTLVHLQPPPSLPAGAIASVWNPFDVTDGRAPEPPEKILRNAPEAYRARQLRAITLADYVQRAEEVPGVARAVARYAWTGSWRCVRLCLDPLGSTELTPALRAAVAAHLEAVRLIGEDLELRPPRFVPLSIDIELCLQPDYWVEDLRYVIEQELSDGWTADGRRGFFHPDAWTFGQSLHRSELEGRLHAIPGVEHLIAIRMRRFDAATPGTADPEVLEAGFDEIFLVRNDPDHLELGSLQLTLRGGRQ